MSKHTYTANYTYNLESGRTSETRVFLTLREAMDFVRNNNNAAGYVLRQHYMSEYAPENSGRIFQVLCGEQKTFYTCGNDIIKFFGGIEKRLSASEQERLVNLCGTCRVLPAGYAETAGKVIKVLVTGASLIIPAFAARGIDKTAALVRRGNLFRLAYIHAGGAARFTMTGETA